jgi:hypothetical protein
VTTPPDRKAIASAFAGAVNISADELNAWLATDESRAAGWKGADGERRESVGHASGRRIVQILRSRESELTEADYAHM